MHPASITDVMSDEGVVRVTTSAGPRVVKPIFDLDLQRILR